MQFRIYDRQTLAYKDGGYVASYTIDDDYIVNNNSKITIVKELNDKVVVGDTIALIDTSGAYHKGTITNFDNSDFSILYKSDKELFNDNILNPKASDYAQDEELKIAGSFGLDYIATMLNAYFGEANDWARALPLKIITDGEVEMLWNWSNASINIVDWLVSLFERYNVSLSWTIDFNIANPLNERKPFYIVTLSAVSNSGKIIKDNVANQTITYTEKELPEATVCVIIDKETKEIVKNSSGTNLFNPATIKKNTILSYNANYNYVQEQSSPGTSVSGFIKVNVEKQYVLSFNKYDGNARNIIGYNNEKNPIWSESYNFTNTENKCIQNISFTGATAYIKINYYYLSTELQFEQKEHTSPPTASPYDAYNKPAIYYLINREGRDMITTDSEDRGRVFPVKTKYVEFDITGEDTTEEETARDTLIPSKFNQAIEIKISADSKMFDFENVLFGDLFKIINEQGTIDSNYTGRKEESGNKWITLYFGLGRQNYTDLQQIKWRKSKYQVLYNKEQL